MMRASKFAVLLVQLAAFVIAGSSTSFAQWGTAEVVGAMPSTATINAATSYEIMSTAPACRRTSYDPREIAAAIKSSGVAPQAVKDRSCMWGGAARAESSGNLCAHNSSNFGILQ